MYHVYIIDESAYDSKKQICETSSIDTARARVQKELAKNSETKYVIEETRGSVDSYGELIATVIEEN